MTVSTSRSTAATAQRERLAKLQREVESLREQLRSTQRRAAVGTMLAMVAHEFNNILTPIISYAQLAKSNPALSDKAIARAADGGQRASEICKALLGLVGEDQARPVRVNLCRIIADTIVAMAREPQKDGIDLNFDIPVDLTVLARPIELQQVVLNLLLNAREAVMDRSTPRRIDITTEADGPVVLLHVADNGAGISPENLRDIFLPYFTTRRDAKGDSHGHGLGLAICREIITSLDGEISVDSTLGEGTKFTVRLPR